MAAPGVAAGSAAAAARRNAAAPKARHQRDRAGWPRGAALCRRRPVKVERAHEVPHQAAHTRARGCHTEGVGQQRQRGLRGAPREGEHQGALAAQLLGRRALVPDDVHDPRRKQLRRLAAVEETGIQAAAVAHRSTVSPNEDERSGRREGGGGGGGAATKRRLRRAALPRRRPWGLVVVPSRGAGGGVLLRGRGSRKHARPCTEGSPRTGRSLGGPVSRTSMRRAAGQPHPVLEERPQRLRAEVRRRHGGLAAARSGNSSDDTADIGSDGIAASGYDDVAVVIGLCLEALRDVKVHRKAAQ
mmetsp:Transcript_64504/g.192165  ORF Transcript_64504/g.192165 Transcript_64504/m.192165 type:complete len:301 (+) Transcript_64504:687-1589(+)